jgi:hypothetical protein
MLKRLTAAACVATAKPEKAGRPCARIRSASLASVLVALTLGGCLAAGSAGTETTQHWIRPPESAASNLQPMPTAGQYAADTQVEPAAAQWSGNGSVADAQDTPGALPANPNHAPDASLGDAPLGDAGTPPSAWAVPPSVPPSVPPAGTADAALPVPALLLARPVVSRAAASAAAAAAPSIGWAAEAPASVAPVVAATQSVPPVAAAPLPAVRSLQPTRIAQAYRAKAFTVRATASSALPLPSTIAPPESHWAQFKQKPAVVRAAAASAPKATAQTRYMPASRVIASVNPEPTAAPNPAPPVPTFVVPARQQPSMVQRFGAVTIDYSVLQ